MGTYTTNKNLFMPSVGETGWGELVNNNFSTIDTFLKPITVSGSTYTFTGNHVGNQSGGSISATTGTFSGAVKGASFNGVAIKSSGTCTVTPTSTLRGYIQQSQELGLLLIPPRPGVLFSGSIKAKNTNTNGTLKLSISAYDPINNETIGSPSVGIGEDTTLTFTNLPYLKIWKGNNLANGRYYDFKIT